MAEIPSHIFKSYDIRGLWKTELSENLACALGSAYVDFLRKSGTDFEGNGQADSSVSGRKKMVVGRDMRESSPAFAAAVIRGIQAQGVDVVDIGMCTTPLFNFACGHFAEYAGGIMVTASHNPSEYNGFKLSLGNGLAVGMVNGMEQIRDSILNNSFEIKNEASAGADLEGDGSVDDSFAGSNSAQDLTVVQQLGGLEEFDPFPEYQKRIFSFVSPDEIKPLKIVIDSANGMGGVTFPRLLKSLPQVQVEYLYIEPDGTFPNHEANPLKTETLADLQKKVVEVGADFGFALDGDADRIGAVNERGEVMDPSFVIALIGQDLLKTNPGATMLYDLRSSRIIKEVWEVAGAKTEMTRVGHTYIKKQMEDTGAVFGSELSLHLYYRDMYKVECTELSLMYLLRLVSEANKPIGELAAPLAKYYHSGEINFEVADKDAAMRAVREKYAANVVRTSDMDGVWMEFDWGWFSVRASNTEPVLRLNLEAWDSTTMKEKLAEVTEVIQER